MHRLGWVVVGLALLEAGWLAFDGARALLVGDYFTPSSGPYAGQLGPWAKVVVAIGLEPRSTLVRAMHLGLGAGWLAVLACYVRRIRWAWSGMLACAVLGLWYLPFGTLLSLAQVVLLSLPAVREGGTRGHPKPDPASGGSP